MKEDTCPEFLEIGNHTDKFTPNRVLDINSDADARLRRIYVLCNVLEEYIVGIPMAQERLNGIKQVIRDRAVFIRNELGEYEDPSNKCSANRKGY